VTIAEAIRKLRGEESQQFFASDLRISLRAFHHYEAGLRLPEPRQLVALACHADRVGEAEMRAMFLRELVKQLRPLQDFEATVELRRAK